MHVYSRSFFKSSLSKPACSRGSCTLGKTHLWVSRGPQTLAASGCEFLGHTPSQGHRGLETNLWVPRSQQVQESCPELLCR